MAERYNDEQILLANAQAGDVSAFNALVLRYQDYLFTVAYRIMGDSESAADVAQDAFMTAYQKLDTFRGGNFKAWLARIASNACYDELRRQKRRPQDYLEDMGGEDSADEPPIASDTPNPEQEMLRSDLNQAIQQCIQSLGDDQRLVLVMSDVEGFNYQEIADQINSNLGTVKSRLSRARLAIRRCLQAFQELLPTEYRLSSED